MCFLVYGELLGSVILIMVVWFCWNWKICMRLLMFMVFLISVVIRCGVDIVMLIFYVLLNIYLFLGLLIWVIV